MQFMRYQGGFALLLALLFSFPIPQPLIHQSMLLHMAVQLPLLLLAGYWLMQACPDSSQQLDWPLTMSAWIWVYCTLIFWMLPIHLDKVLVFASWDIAKIISLLLAGGVLYQALQAPLLWGAFFIGSLAIGLIFVGVYYQQAEVRVCSNYLIASQQHAGIALLAWGVVLLLYLLLKSKHKLWH